MSGPTDTRLLIVLNEAAWKELTEAYSLNPTIADRIVANRPYASNIDFLERAIIPKRAYDQLRAEILNYGAPSGG